MSPSTRVHRRTVADIVTDNAPRLSRRSLLMGAAALAGTAVAACSGRTSPRAAPLASAPTVTGVPTASPSPTAPPPDPAAVHANEVGVIPVLMHHRLLDKVESDFDMTAKWFRSELDRLHNE